MSRPVEWFWSHRRRAALLHMSFFMRGLAGNGWQPAVDFAFDHQLIILVPEKGIYIFYDKNYLSSGSVKYRGVQESIDRNPDFVRDFRRRTDELFGAVFFKCLDIDNENLALLSLPDLAKLHEDWLSAVMVGPIITVQLWGIEACFDEKYRILSFLREKLDKLGKGKEFETYKGLLAVNTGETVAFTEQKNFYQVAAKLQENEAVRTLFMEEGVEAISEKLRRHPAENALFTKHTEKYEWMNKEYTGDGWPREKWLELFKKAFVADVPPAEKLSKMLADFHALVREREKVIEELDPPKEVRHALDALAELIAQRDWTKGYFTRALLSYHRLLDEIAERLGATRDDLFLHTYRELKDAMATGKPLPQAELASRRKDGAVLVIKGDSFELTTGREGIDRVIKEEGVGGPFEKMSGITEFKGLPASLGKITGRARVLENASGISELEEGEILVTYMTTIEFIPAFRKAAAIITDEGGMSCHAAIVSREFKLPCIVGTKVATRALQTGDLIEVDAERGVVRILEQH